MSIILTGYRGSGKTTVGRKLAKRLGWPFVDSDEWITENAAKTIAEIFSEDGEPAFRDLEAQAVAEAMKLKDHVIALGGGALMREENRLVIQRAKHKVIYFRCEPEELHRRISADFATAANRPHLTTLAGSLAEIQTLLAKREPTYRSAMTHELDVTKLTDDEVVAEILRIL